MEKMLVLKKNLEKKSFNQVLNLCFELSTHFSFTNHKAGISDNDYAEFLQELQQFYVRTISTHHWFCFYVEPTESFTILLFNAEDGAKSIIKKYFDNLFLHERIADGTLGNVKNLPEDMCFFVGDQLLLGTVSHEHMCYVYPPSEHVYSEFKKIGKWNEEDYLKEEHIIL